MTALFALGFCALVYGAPLLFVLRCSRGPTKKSQGFVPRHRYVGPRETVIGMTDPAKIASLRRRAIAATKHANRPDSDSRS